MTPAVQIFEDPQQLAEAAAGQFAAAARDAIAARGCFRVALAGGQTPRRLYRLLADHPAPHAVDWSRVDVFFGDERDVPPDHPQSNFRMARETLLDHVALDAERIHPMRTRSASLRRDAARYGALLRRRTVADADGWPQLDLVLLGVGRDGHTASLFPATCVLHELQLTVAAVYVPQQNGWRLTLTIPVLERARQLLFLVSGAEKSSALARTLSPAANEPLLPVQRLQSRGEVAWFCDRAAASDLPAAGYAS